MAIKKTQWSPDTCGCLVEYSWDTNDPPESRIHTFSRVVKACPEHILLSTPATIYDQVLRENQNKNKVYRAILENISSAVDSSVDKDGNILKELKPGKEYRYTFDSQRRLVVDLPGFTAQEKLDVETASSGIDSGKIIILKSVSPT